MTIRLLTLLALLPLTTGGCVAKAALDLATLPVKAASQAVDWSTTSQSEADRNAGRKLRKKEEREGREGRERDRQCRRNPEDCGQD